jgi:hypothetical protein
MIRDWRPGELAAVVQEWDRWARVGSVIIAAYVVLNVAIVAGWLPCTPWLDIPLPIGPDGMIWRVDWPPGMIGCDIGGRAMTP